ncbi:outer dense fiber protein 3-like isoform X2 [Pocillopora damicornis]|uniref:outer dense fiber protein 3-like isoform X2 n=1 Tax=Pocillopora damicornis TaxID=46731 RepID=UPI000F55775A|nr:outer dense fiber protein 3-like isoform X2 [Pocillopora damicornis]
MPDSRDGQVVKLPQIAARERGPGPARYMLKSLCRSDSHDITKHRNPAYSLGPRLQPVKSFNSPGPCYLPAPGVTSVGPDGTPKWSMLGAASKTTKFNPPGPGQYSPEKFHPPHERSEPSFTFGKRTKILFKDPTPSPNSYSLPPLIGPKGVNKASAPAYSLSGRSAIGGFSEDLKKTPGPGTYEVTHPNTSRKRMPAYTMNGRNYMPTDTTLKPGPGQHSPEKVVYNKPTAPKFSFGIRHSDYMTVPLFARD